MLVLVTYDISITTPDGQGRLRRVAKLYVDYGVRVQNTVFECRVDATQHTRLKHEIRNMIDEDKDSKRFYRLGDHYMNKVEHFGVTRGLAIDEPLIFLVRTRSSQRLPGDSHLKTASFRKLKPYLLSVRDVS